MNIINTALQHVAILAVFASPLIIAFSIAKLEDAIKAKLSK